MAESVQEKYGFYRDGTPYGLVGKWIDTYEAKSETTPLVVGGKSPPGWRRRRDRGEILPVLSYNRKTVEVSRSPASGTFYRYWDNGNVSQKIVTDWFYKEFATPTRTDVSPHEPSAGDIAAAVNSAIADSSAGVMQAAVTAIEAKETYRLLLSAATRLVDLVKIIRADVSRRNSGLSRGKRGKPVSFEDLWLEYRYGWRPLIAEVYSAIEAFNSKLQKGDRKHGTGVRTFQGQDSVTWEFTDGDHRFVIEETSEIETRVGGFALSEVTNVRRATFGLNPLSTFWEAVTLSFVVDWFFDIGSFLAANSAEMSGYKLVASGHSIRKRRVDTVRLNILAIGGSSGGYFGQECITTTTEFTRQSGGGGGLPSFSFPIKPAQIADLVAILMQMAKAPRGG